MTWLTIFYTVIFPGGLALIMVLDAVGREVETQMNALEDRKARVAARLRRRQNSWRDTP